MVQKGVVSSSCEGAWKVYSFEGRNVYLTTINTKATLFCVLVLKLKAFCGRAVYAMLSYTVYLLRVPKPLSCVYVIILQRLTLSTPIVWSNKCKNESI